MYTYNKVLENEQMAESKSTVPIPYKMTYFLQHISIGRLMKLTITVRTKLRQVKSKVAKCRDKEIAFQFHREKCIYLEGKINTQFSFPLLLVSSVVVHDEHDVKALKAQYRYINIC